MGNIVYAGEVKKGEVPVPDYREMYLHLMRETERAIRILIEAQRTCEEVYLRDEEPHLTVLPGGAAENRKPHQTQTGS